MLTFTGEFLEIVCSNNKNQPGLINISVNVLRPDMTQLQEQLFHTHTFTYYLGCNLENFPHKNTVNMKALGLDIRCLKQNIYLIKMEVYSTDILVLKLEQHGLPLHLQEMVLALQPEVIRYTYIHAISVANVMEKDIQKLFFYFFSPFCFASLSYSLSIYVSCFSLPPNTPPPKMLHISQSSVCVTFSRKVLQVIDLENEKLKSKS